MSSWIVRLRSHDGGGILEKASYGTPDAAMSAYRALLAREDLDGQPVAAVFKPPAGMVQGGNVSTFYSRFDRPLGSGRIAPDDPRLDPHATADEAHRVADTPSPEQALPVDWEADERPFAEVCKAWAKATGSRDEAPTGSGSPAKLLTAGATAGAPRRRRCPAPDDADRQDPVTSALARACPGPGRPEDAPCMEAA